MSEEPYQVERVQYVEAERLEPAAPTAQIQPLVYQSNGLPCCSGCGCLILLAVAILFFQSGLLTGLVVFLAALVLSASALRLTGIRQWSPAYVLAFVPLFLLCVNLTAKLVRGSYPYTAPRLVGATLAIYLILYFARALGRR